MTAVAHDPNVTDEAGGALPASCLPRHALVYLWAPGESDTSKPALVKVHKATAHAIIGRDLGSRANAQYDISELTAPGNRWTWELAAEPEIPLAGDIVQLVDLGQLDREERRQLLLGASGQSLTFHLVDGTSVSGVVTLVLFDGDLPVLLTVSNLPDSQREWDIRVPVDKITQIKEVKSV